MTRSLFVVSFLHSISLLFSRVFSVLAFFFLAKIFQASEIGTLSLFLTLSSLLTLIFDLGLIQWYLSAAKRVEYSTEKMFALRFFSWFVSFIIALVCFNIFPVFHWILILLFCLNLLPEAFLSVSDGWYILHKKSYLIGVKNSLRYGLMILSLFLVSSTTITTVLFFYVFGSYLLSIWYLPFRHLNFSQIFTTPKKSVALLADSKHYAGLITLSALYSRADQIFIEFFLGRAMLGSYALAYRYLDLSVLFPTTVGQNLFSRLSSMRTQEKNTVLFPLFLMGCLGVICGLVVFSLSTFLTTGLFAQSEFVQSTQVLRIFSLSLPFFFLNAVLAVIAQRAANIARFLPFAAANTAFNIIWNVVFLPRWGITAAAWGMVLSEFTGLMINLFFFFKWRTDSTHN